MNDCHAAALTRAADRSSETPIASSPMDSSADRR